MNSLRFLLILCLCVVVYSHRTFNATASFNPGCYMGDTYCSEFVLKPTTDGTSCTSAAYTYLKTEGCPNHGNGDDCGHIVAKRFGGSGGKGNVFCQNSKINQGIFNQFEQKIADCFADGSTGAFLEWDFYYGGASKTRPTSYSYTATFSSPSSVQCEILSETFANPA